MADPVRMAALLDAVRARDPSDEPGLQEALAELLRLGDGAGVAWATLGLATLATRRGDAHAAAELLDRGLAAVGDTDRIALVRLLNARGAVALELDQWSGALAPLIAASRMGEDSPEDAMRAQQNLAFCLVGLRDFAGAEGRFHAALRTSAGIGGTLHAFNLFGLSLALSGRGQIEPMRAVVAELEATDDPRPAAMPMIRGLAAAVRADVALADQRWEDAIAEVEASREDVVRLGVSTVARMAKIASRAAEALGRRPAARAYLDQALALDLGPSERFEALTAAGELARRDGDLAKAVVWLQEATGLARDDGTTGRTMAQVMERAADGIHRRDAELAAANEALNRSYQAVERGRRGLEDRVTERTRQLADEVAVRRAAEERAIRSSDAKSRLLANMSHELRTPLNAILGYAELLAEDVQAEHREDLAAIQRAGHLLLRLIDQLLELARVESGPDPLDPIPVELDPLLDSVVAEGATRANRVVRVVRAGGGLGTYSTDPVRVRQILAQLLSNAARHCQDGTITVGGRREGPRLELWVEDTGVGIAAERLPHLFEPFEGADGTARVGLAICRQLAASLGGQISVQSRLGEGARFVVRLIERG